MKKMTTKINRSLRQEMNPIPTVSSIGSNPRAAPTSKSRWMRRSVRVRTTGGTSAPTNVTFNDIGTSMGSLSGEAYTVKVLGVRSWNITPLATTDNRILATVGADVFTTSVPIEAEDYGCGMQLPGVKINVPDILAKSNATTSLQPALVITASALANQTYLTDFDIMYQM